MRDDNNKSSGNDLDQKQAQLDYHAQLFLPADKGRAIKELVVCWVLPYLIPWAIERVTL